MKCPHCQEEIDLDCSEKEDGDSVRCDSCGEVSFLWLGELVDENDYHESSCDSIAAERYEDRAFGDD